MNEGLNKEEKKPTFDEIYESVGKLSEEEIKEALTTKRIGFGNARSQKSTEEIVSRAENGTVFTVKHEAIKIWGEEAKKKFGKGNIEFIVGE